MFFHPVKDLLFNPCSGCCDLLSAILCCQQICDPPVYPSGPTNALKASLDENNLLPCFEGCPNEFDVEIVELN